MGRHHFAASRWAIAAGVVLLAIGHTALIGLASRTTLAVAMGAVVAGVAVVKYSIWRLRR